MVGVTIFLYGAFSSAATNNECKFAEFQIAKVLFSNETTLTKCKIDLKHSELIAVLKVIDRYWSLDLSNKDRYVLLSDSYKKALLKVYKISGTDDYFIPLIEYERSWQGYKLNEITVISTNNIEVSVQVHWEQEGYEGTNTYVMNVSYSNNQWLINNIHW